MSDIGMPPLEHPRSGSWLYTAWIVTVLVVLLPPLRLMLQFIPPGRTARAMVRRCARRVVAATGCPVEITGAEHLSGMSSAMFVVNHSSMADAAFLLASLPFEFWFIAHAASGSYPILGLAVRRASYAMVDRESWRDRARCGRAMTEALLAGESLVVFPEGTFDDSGTMLPFRSGAFRAAAKSGRPVVPIVLRGTRAMFPPAGRLSRARITIEILAPLGVPADSRTGIAAVRDAAAAAIAARLDTRE